MLARDCSFSTRSYRFQGFQRRFEPKVGAWGLANKADYRAKARCPVLQASRFLAFLKEPFKRIATMKPRQSHPGQLLRAPKLEGGSLEDLWHIPEWSVCFAVGKI